VEQEFLLSRIIRGRLNYRRGDLLLYIKEPTQELMFDSIEIYEEAYDKAYHSGVYLKEDIVQMLMDYNIWHPGLDKVAETHKKNIEELKFAAFKNFYNLKQLQGIKFQIRQEEKKLASIYAKKYSLDHLSCEGVASYTKWNWIIENSTFYRTGQKYDWKELTLINVVSHYESQVISNNVFRSIARNDPWRSMWVAGKKGGNLFGLPSCEYTKDQLLLCSFSCMYDNVYESSEAPDEKVIDDDDCLDGWFVDQRKKMEQFKKQQSADNLLSSKAGNSKEVFLMAQDIEDIDYIHSLNTDRANQVRKERLDLVQRNKIVSSDSEFTDIKQELITQNNKAFVEQLKGK